MASNEEFFQSKFKIILRYFEDNFKSYSYTKYCYDRLSLLDFDYWDDEPPSNKCIRELIMKTVTSDFSEHSSFGNLKLGMLCCVTLIEYSLTEHFSFWSHLENGVKASEVESFNFYDPALQDDASVVPCPICR
jgi:hypothetical protein